MGDPSVEDVAANWGAVVDMSGAAMVSAGSMEGVKNVTPLMKANPAAKL